MATTTQPITARTCWPDTLPVTLVGALARWVVELAVPSVGGKGYPGDDCGGRVGILRAENTLASRFTSSAAVVTWVETAASWSAPLQIRIRQERGHPGGW
jgi:hypothetical protein